MRKKLLLCLLMFAFVLSLCACGASTLSETEPLTEIEYVTEPELLPESVIEYEVTFTSCKAVSADGCYVHTVVAIENTGTEALSLSRGYYDVKDENGVVIESPIFQSDIPYVAPGDVVYFSTLNRTDNTQYATASELNVEPHFEVDKTLFIPVTVEVADLNLEYIPDSVYSNYGSSWNQQGAGFVATGNITNTSSERISTAIVSVVLFSGETPIGVLLTWANSISPGATTSFETSNSQLKYFIEPEQVTGYKAFVCPFT